MSTDKVICDALDIAEFEVETQIQTVNAVDSDYDFARKNIRTIIEKGTVALERMIDIADMSQHPRSYEVVSDLIKSLSETNKDLITLSEKSKKIEIMSNNTHQTINNNLYITTAELQKLIGNN